MDAREIERRWKEKMAEYREKECGAEYHFDFCVSGLSRERCEEMMRCVVIFVDQERGKVGGGFELVEESDVESQERQDV